MQYHVNFFGIEMTIDPVAFTLPFGNFQIRWYGIIIAFGFLLALIYAFRNAARFEVNGDRMIDVILVATPVAILAARAYYILFADGSWADFFNFQNGGLAIYGGVIGAAVSAVLMCKWRKVSLPAMLDLAALGFLIGQGIGRWGNFFNQEAFGELTGSTFFGMQSESTQGILGYGMAHPCFLYESVFCLLGFILLHIYSKKKQRFKGEIALLYGVWYGFGRFWIEGLRTDSLMLGKLRVSQLLSALLFTVCLVLWVILRKRVRREQPAGYKPVFAEAAEVDATPEAGEQIGTEQEDLAQVEMEQQETNQAEEALRAQQETKEEEGYLEDGQMH